MHENQQYKRANQSMSFDSMNSSISKISHKKTPFYQHEDSAKLNYYARFSPNRKKIDEQFESHILEGTSPLSPRSNKSSSKTRRSKLSMKSKHKNQDKDKEQVGNVNFQLIDSSLLLSINQKNLDRNQIYIDEEEQSQESNGYQQVNPISKNLFKNTNQPTQKDQQKSKLNVWPQITYPNNQGNNQHQESQQSSSFDRIIEQSSSDENQIISVPKVSTGLQMRIEDDDSDDEQQNQRSKQFNQNDDHVLIFDCSEQKIFELAESIGSVKIQKRKNSEHREVKSENVSFSVDSDLSMIQENWNSYFEAENDEISYKSELQKNQNILSQKISQIDHKNKRQFKEELNSRKMSQSSDQELPSFSNPSSSNCITPVPSRPQSIYDRNEEHQMNEDEKKEFKRQYTFGYELNSAFNNEQSNENKIETQKSVPLFMKFLSKETISGFTKSKLKSTKHPNIKAKKQVGKIELVQRQKVTKKPQKRLIPIKNTFPHNTNKNPQIEQLPIVQQQEPIIEKPFVSNQILIEEDPSQSESQIFEQKAQLQIPHYFNKPEIIIEEHQSPPMQVTFQIQNIKKQNFSSAKLYEKAKNNSNWKKNIHIMLEKQRKQSQNLPQIITQNQHEFIHQKSDDFLIPEKITPSIKILAESADIQQPQKQQKQQTPTKYQQSTGYAKIYSKRGLCKRKAKTQLYQEKLKLSQSHYHSSDNDDLDSQNCDESHPKGSERQSLTTATEQMTYNFHSQTFYSPKRKSNGIQEVQNLKRYLKKMDESSKIQRRQEILKGKFYINQSLEQLETERSSLPEIVPLEKDEKHRNQQVNISNAAKQNVKISPQKNQQKAKFIIPLSIPQFKQAQLQKQSLPSIKSGQVKQAQQQKHPETFVQSLKMLEDLIPTLPNELIPTYEKIYTHVYEQQLKYQMRIEKQAFLMDFMEQFVKGQKEKIDCQGFLSSEHLEMNSNKQMKFSTDEQELQIFINKHIIMTLVRKLASP